MPFRRFVIPSTKHDFWERVTIGCAFMFLVGPWAIGLMFLVYHFMCWGWCN